MEPAGFRVPSLVPPMTQFHTICRSTETGRSGFHFVDNAAPPKALKALADELRRRNRAISWWGNIRFEKSFTLEPLPAACRQRLHRRLRRPRSVLPVS